MWTVLRENEITSAGDARSEIDNVTVRHTSRIERGVDSTGSLWLTKKIIYRIDIVDIELYTRVRRCTKMQSTDFKIYTESRRSTQ